MLVIERVHCTSASKTTFRFNEQ